MRKLLGLLLALLVLCTFAACGGNEEAPAEEPAPTEEATEAPEETEESEPANENASEDEALLHSVIFTESDAILSLGDERARFDDVLGESAENGDLVSYLDGTFSVRFRDGVAITFVRMWEFERIVFPAFDANRSISSIMRDLMFDPFFEHPSADHVYVRTLEIGEMVYVLQVTVGLTNGELSHVESIALNVFDG